MVFVCHVTFQDHVVKALIDVLVRSSSKSVTILPSFVAMNTMVVKI